ncbi:non-ribosomal peptide synthetase [Flavobacterium sp. CLA17]|uniref:non-ribosomal peptide synthetase n=1 Tax=Flavobacterium sp. CLA17 TaxID=2724135 RepID=UPI0014912D37|nr:non-ribosomal peptide synthetase [Flavobacterium sp. CLA17]QSB25089.1 amino acid adenylation domain-containing protein [Flavobacterium sp. CLA17]
MDIALIGVSIKYADITTLQQFAAVIRNNSICVKQPAEERILHSKIDKKEKYHPYGYLDRVDFFDHEFFNLSKGEANTIDPGHRMILQGVCNAIENSGYDLDYIASQNTGLFTTTQTGLYNLLYQSENKGLDFIGGLASIGGGRVANILNIRGPVMNIDTACSSSLVAVHEAVQNIRRGEIDLGIVAGSRLLYLFNEADSFEKDAIMSTDGMCRAFDEEASGTAGGEGVAVVILKRLDHAIRDHDTILSVIKGSAINNDGSSSNSITAPSPVAQKNVILSACKNANIAVTSVGYIETHGTGTKLGDPIEYKGIKDAFSSTNEPFSVRLGTLKPNIGHLDNMSGLFGFIKAALVLREKEFFPLANFNTVNKFIEEDPNILLQKEGAEWVTNEIRRAGVSSFGLSGTNAHIILEEYTATEEKVLNTGTNNWFKVAAKSKNALKEYTDSIYNFISESTSIADLAYTLNTGRKDYKYRLAVSGNTVAAIKESLLAQKDNDESNTAKYTKIALLYLSDEVQHVESFLKCDQFKDVFLNLQKEIASDETEPAVSKTVAVQVALFKYLSAKGFNVNQLICNGDIAKASKEIIEGKNSISKGLTFDKEFVLDLAKLKALAKNCNDNNILLVVVGNNSHSMPGIFESLKEEQIPGIDVLQIMGDNNWNLLWSTFYNKGLEFDWKAFYSKENYKKVTAPTYPFEKTSCWNEHKNPLFFNQSNQKPEAEKPKLVIENLSEEETVVGILKEILKNDTLTLTDDFFELGGNSIVGVQFINRINELFAITINFDALFECYEISEIVTLIKEAVEAKNKNSFIALPLTDQLIFETLEASNSQQRMWIESLLDTSMQSIYNITLTYNAKGNLNIEVFKETLQELIRMHACLRSTFFTDEDGTIQQRIKAIENIAIDHFFTFYSNTDSLMLEQKKKEIQNFNFDLEQGPLFQAAVLQTDENKYQFIFVFHHIIFDGWSTGIFIKDFVAVYKQIISKAYVPAASKNDYFDYLIWLKGNLHIEKTAAYSDYWREKLGNINSNLKLGNPDTGSLEGARFHFSIDKKLKDKLVDYTTKNRVTLFSLLISSVRISLYRLAQENFVIGTAVSGRVKKEFESTIGMFINTLPVYTEIDGDKSFADAVADEMNTIMKALEYQTYPYDLILNDLKIANKKSFFDVMVVLQNQNNRAGMVSKSDLPFEIEEEINPISTFSRFNLSFTFFDVLDAIELELEYKAGVFSQEFIQAMMDTFFHLLEQFVAVPEKKISQFSILNENQFENIVYRFNDTKSDFPEDKTLIELFEEQVEKTPDNIAVIFEDKELSYRELNAEANQLGRYLRALFQIKPDDLIGIKLERSEKMILAVLGILKSGAAYVPIDPAYPQERIDYIGNDSNCKIIIDENVLTLFYKNQDVYSVGNIEKINSPTDLAYIIYTSGTTGNPKGVMVEHTNVVNLILSQTKQFKIDENEKILQLSNYTFDASVEQIFLALCNGAGLYLISRAALLEAEIFEEFIAKNEITHLHAVPSVLEKITPRSRFSLKRVIAGGDSCSEKLAESWSTVCDFYNEYGPTETTVTSIELLYDKKSTFCIGSPIANTQVYILDNNLFPTQLGVLGKIYISGAGVTRGYLNKPELTAEKFIENPFVSNTKMYDTGDLGRWLPDGTIEFLGRKDDQVKIRGFRIELGEIENALSQFSEDLRQVVVQPQQVNGDKTLVAYYVSDTELDKAEIRRYLHTKLPEYMVPSFLVVLEHLPLTANGKVDRTALRGISEEDIIRKAYVEPRNEIEQKIAEIWQEILGVEKVGVTDSFFELGGHSLNATKLISIIHKQFNVKLSIIDLFDNIILEELALLLENTLLYSTKKEENISIEESENFTI